MKRARNYNAMKKMNSLKTRLHKLWEFSPEDINRVCEKYNNNFEENGEKHFLVIKELVKRKTEGMKPCEIDAYLTSVKIRSKNVNDIQHIKKLKSLIPAVLSFGATLGIAEWRNGIGVTTMDVWTILVFAIVYGVLSFLVIYMEFSKRVTFNEEVFPYLERNLFQK